MDDFDESDCCGNGCANCVLNIKPAKPVDANKSGKRNILGKYTTFVLINKSLHLPQVENVWELHFKSKYSNDNNFMLVIKAGYHLMMRKRLTFGKGMDTKSQQKYLLRPYSPFWWDVMDMEFKILVNIIPNGPMSEYIKNLQINDEVEFRGPIGIFEHQLDENGDTCLLIISQGIAIAPIIPVIEDIISNDYDMTRIVHIACFQDLKHIYFRDKLYNFSKFWNYKVNIYVSKELCDNTDCKNNLYCLDSCKKFKSKLKYKEIVIPHRLMNNDFYKIVDSLGQTKENTCVTISGTGIFQNYFKELCQTTDCGFLKNNINLL